jgi:type IV secretory pathway VirB2 component (pilin)
LTLGPSWLPLAVILVLALPLTIASLWGRHEWRRMLSFIGLVTITIAVAAAASS